jgi:hypothetical protein
MEFRIAQETIRRREIITPLNSNRSSHYWFFVVKMGSYYFIFCPFYNWPFLCFARIIPLKYIDSGILPPYFSREWYVHGENFILYQLCSCFQRRTFPFLWFPELSPASATSFSQQQLTTESQRLSNCNWVWVLCYDRRSVGQSVLV